MKAEDSRTAGLKSRLRIARWYDHMDHTLHVMVDRSMWFAPIYETISANHFKQLVSHEPRLRGAEAKFEEPVRFACGYAVDLQRD